MNNITYKQKKYILISNLDILLKMYFYMYFSKDKVFLKINYTQTLYSQVRQIVNVINLKIIKEINKYKKLIFLFYLFTKVE